MEKERYKKEDILQYEDGWWITFKAGNQIRKVNGPHKSKSIADTYRQTININTRHLNVN